MIKLLIEIFILVIKILPNLFSALTFADINIKNQNYENVGKKLLRFFVKRGGLFPKFGQLISHRRDVFPEPLCNVLLSLTENVPVFDTQIALKILESEVPKLKLTSFNNNPIGSASIAQVHYAILETGKEVAIKIQRPNIESLIRNDLKSIQIFVRIIDFLKVLPRLQDIFNEFKGWLLDQELFFLKEAQNLIKANQKPQFTPVFPTNIDLQTNAPKVYIEYCTDKILVMEFIQGRTLSNISTKKDLNIETRKETIIQALRCFMKQFLIDGFFQADPHLSNLILSDGKLYFIDWGLIGNFSDQNAMYMLRMYRGFLFRDRNLCWHGLTNLLKISENDQFKIQVDFKNLFDKFESDIKFLLNRPYREAGSEFLLTLMRLMVKYKINIPSEAALAFKTMATSDAVYTAVYPELTVRDMIDTSLDVSQLFITKLISKSSIMNLFLEKILNWDAVGLSKQIEETKDIPILGKALGDIFKHFNLIDTNLPIEQLLNNSKLLKLRLKQIEEMENLWLSLQTKIEV